MNTKIITVGEKLKEIRKKYNIKQYELSGTELTRNMISMIETNKAGLTKSTAETLLKNIYKICEEKSIECNVTLEYLLESAEYQAQKICNEFIKLLNSNSEIIFQREFQSDLNEIQKLLDKYKLKDQKFIIYKKLSELFSDSQDFYKAYIYSLKAFENYDDPFNDVEFINLIIEITYYCNKLKKYKDILNFSKLAYIYMTNIPKDKEFKLKFNSILAYKNLKDYDSALKEIKEIECNFKEFLNIEPIEKINIMILKANCLNEESFYLDALQIHKKILDLTKDNIELHIVTLCNILDIYIKLNDSKNIKEYTNKCIFLLKKYEQIENKKFSPEIYNIIGLGYYNQGKFEICKIYFNNSLKESKKYKKEDIIISSFEKLLNISIHSNCKNEINDLKNQLLEIISLKLLPINNIAIFQFIKYYNDIGDSESINDLVNFAKSQFLDY